MTDERPTLTISTMTSGPHKATYLVATSNTELFDLYDLTMSGLWAELNKYPATCAAVRCIELCRGRAEISCGLSLMPMPPKAFWVTLRRRFIAGSMT
ncbi:hypothetical protein IPG36_06935 [bacterium]|nr:MAG: hypothetical protein IPG36_06935 [bacterium]